MIVTGDKTGAEYIISKKISKTAALVKKLKNQFDIFYELHDLSTKFLEKNVVESTKRYVWGVITLTGNIFIIDR